MATWRFRRSTTNASPTNTAGRVAASASIIVRTACRSTTCSGTRCPRKTTGGRRKLASSTRGFPSTATRRAARAARRRARRPVRSRSRFGRSSRASIVCSAEAMSAVGWEIVDPLYYERYGYPHASWAFLRKHAPVSWLEPEGMHARPFWAITKHRDLEAISRDPKRFQIAPRLAVFSEDRFREQRPTHDLLGMDPPEHGKYRGLMASRFTPKALERKREAVGRIVDDLLDAMVGRDELDFVASLAAVVPLAVINEML